MQNPRTAIDNDDPRQAWLKRLADAWKPATPVDNNGDNNNDDVDPHVGYARRLTADSGVPNFGVRMNDSRVIQLHDSVGPPTLPTTGAALRQIREDRQRQGGTA